MRIFSATALAWSINSTRTPRWPAIAAQCRPAAPAPTMTASTSRITGMIGARLRAAGDARRAGDSGIGAHQPGRPERGRCLEDRVFAERATVVRQFEPRQRVVMRAGNQLAR